MTVVTVNCDRHHMWGQTESSTNSGHNAGLQQSHAVTSEFGQHRRRSRVRGKPCVCPPENARCHRSAGAAGKLSGGAVRGRPAGAHRPLGDELGRRVAHRLIACRDVFRAGVPCVQHRSAVKTKKHRTIPVRALQFLVKHKRKDKGRKTEYTDAL